jgi:hypothetical protein
VPERLLDHHPAPRVALSVRQPVAGKLATDLFEGLRCN